MSSQDELGSAQSGVNGFKPELAVASQLANNLEQTQINKFHTKGGTGFAAEDANSLSDSLCGRKVDHVGKNNSLNGTDRLVDGVKIQTKYYESPASTIRSAFDENGIYRYSGQRLEVPADQYEACLAKMREKISAGKVPGFTNPADAESIVQKGNVTYNQARNIARAGTIDGLAYDAKTHAIGAGLACGLSFAIQFAQLKWNGVSTEKALQEAAITGLNTGALSLSAGILSSQVLRTKAAAIGVVFARDAVRSINSTQAGKVIIEKIAEVSLGRAVYGGAAINHVAKLARSNAVTSVVVTVVMATPDFYRAAFAGNISWSQFGKNLAVNASGVAGGAGGWFAGAAAGAAVGSIVPIIGTAAGGIAGAIIGSIAGGSLVSFGAKKAIDQFVEDDAVAMMGLLDQQLPLIASEFMLNETEFKSFIEFVKQRINAGFLRDLYASGNRDALISGTFRGYCDKLAKQREHITLPQAAEIDAAVAQFLEDAIDAQAELATLEQAAADEDLAASEDIRRIAPTAADSLDRMRGSEDAASLAAAEEREAPTDGSDSVTAKLEASPVATLSSAELATGSNSAAVNRVP